MDERFCVDCAMPLVHVPGPERDPGERRRLARKIKPQYAQGYLVKVTQAQNLSEAELILMLLLEEGIPGLQQRAVGFDQPDYRDILVPESGAEAAREALAPIERRTVD